MNVVGVFLVDRVLMRPEDLRAHDLGKAEDGVERRAELMAHGGEKAGLCLVRFLGARSRLVGDRLRLLELGDQRVLLGAEPDHGGDGGVGAAHQPDEIDVDADSHGGHGPIIGIIEEREADDDRRSHRQRSGIDDRHHRRREQHAHRDDDEKRGKDEGVRRLAGAAGADKSDRRPGEAIEELGGHHLGAPRKRACFLPRRPEELPAEADQEALGEEHRGEPEQQLRRRRPEHRTDRDDDGEERRGDRRRQLVLGEEEEELIIELGAEVEPLAGLVRAPRRAPCGVHCRRSGRTSLG